jgi:hypothetical protein
VIWFCVAFGVALTKSGAAVRPDGGIPAPPESETVDARFEFPLLPETAPVSTVAAVYPVTDVPAGKLATTQLPPDATDAFDEVTVIVDG